jgi:hypothetical protein
VPKKASPKGFARVDSETTNTHGWLVRISRGSEKRSRFFSDSAHGGKAKSKKKAEACYQDWVKEMVPPGSTRDKLTKRNSSGVVGVHLAHEVDSRYPDCQYVSYVASWLNPNGQRRNVRFLVNKYGKKTALTLATIARQNKISDREKVHELYEKSHGTLKIQSGKSTAKAEPKSKVNVKPAKSAKAAEPAKATKTAKVTTSKKAAPKKAASKKAAPKKATRKK